MRHTRAHTKNRRSHHALQAQNLSLCETCGKKKLRHRACLLCGEYRGRMIVDVASRDARIERRKAEKALKES